MRPLMSESPVERVRAMPADGSRHLARSGASESSFLDTSPTAGTSPLSHVAARLFAACASRERRCWTVVAVVSPVRIGPGVVRSTGLDPPQERGGQRTVGLESLAAGVLHLTRGRE